MENLFSAQAEIGIETNRLHEEEVEERQNHTTANGGQGNELVEQVDGVSSQEDLENLEAGYKTIQKTYGILLSRTPGGFRTAMLGARFVGVIRSLQGYANEIERRLSLSPLYDDNPQTTPTSAAATTNCTEEISEEANMILSDSIEFIQGAIGSSCGRFEPVGERFGDPGDAMPSGIKRKICINQTCATRRHKITVRADAIRVSEWIKSSDAEDLMPQIWVHLKGGAEIKLTGLDIRSRLLLQSPLDVEMAEAITRLIRELEAETLFLRSSYAGRHYVGPYWGINVQAGNASIGSSIDLFMQPTPRYGIRRCTIVLTLVCFSGEWSCYAFDFNRLIVSIMDPNMREPVRPRKLGEHSVLASKMVPHVVAGMRHTTGDQCMGRGTWTLMMLLGRGRPPIPPNSGIEAINCMRWFNGNSVCTPPKDGLIKNSRNDLALQLISMDSNHATTPVLRYALSNRPSTAGRPKKRTKNDGREEGEGSTGMSTGSTGVTQPNRIEFI